MNLEGFSIPPLAEELNSALRYARIDKITQPSKSVMYFAMRKPGENLLLCISAATQNPAVYLTKNQPENPSEPPTFCMVLRKQLESGRIAGVRERKGDRIIDMDIDTIGAGGKIITKTLIIELMGKNSNIILTEDNIVIDALRKVGAGKSKTRIILPNNEYIPPVPQEKFDLREDDIESIIKSLKNKKESPLSAAIIDTVSGFGKIHAKEACYLSGLPTGILINSLDDADFLSLKSA
ncbi:MAG: NFACT family protein, partial [Selenomonadaceae bacterium]|nr:NFACT family protein [Selenomonadaceae bacterium]